MTNEQEVLVGVANAKARSAVHDSWATFLVFLIMFGSCAYTCGPNPYFPECECNDEKTN